MGAKKKQCAYFHTEDLNYPNKWAVIICEKNVKGYRVVSDYGPYEVQNSAIEVAKRLNKRLGITEKQAMYIVGTTMPAPALWERLPVKHKGPCCACVSKPMCDCCWRQAKWKHPSGGFRCGICPRPIQL